MWRGTHAEPFLGADALQLDFRCCCVKSQRILLLRVNITPVGLLVVVHLSGLRVFFGAELPRRGQTRAGRRHGAVLAECTVVRGYLAVVCEATAYAAAVYVGEARRQQRAVFLHQPGLVHLFVGLIGAPHREPGVPILLGVRVMLRVMLRGKGLG